MTFYIRLAFTSGLALRIKGAAYFTKSQRPEADNTVRHHNHQHQAVSVGCTIFGCWTAFREVSRVIMETKEVLGIGSIGSCSEGIVSRYARFICAINLQCIAELLRQCWAFSVALDMATHMATSYCNVRIRICHKSTVHDFHLLSFLCMSGTQARLSAIRSPRRWTLPSRTGARRLLERLRMARRR
jgi:hypothetical protein